MAVSRAPRTASARRDWSAVRAEADDVTASPDARMAIPAEDRDFVAALARGFAVLRTFSYKRRRLSIAQISHRTGVSRASVRRSLHTLVVLGYVGEDDAQRYFLRPAVLEFADAYLSATPLAFVAQPVLDRTSEALGEACSIGILDGDEIVYLARSVSSRIISPTINVGRRLPAYCTSIGQVLLAELPKEKLRAYLAGAKLHAYTELTVTSREELRKLLEATAQAGYAVADQQMEAGYCTIAVPVRDGAGVAVAGINVVLPSRRAPVRTMTSRYVPALQRAAEELRVLLS
ncbi:MAG TPA: IclR family transcriptional regulator C-terminal domain-containing protein [Casimicrobiaceae bacterium]|nr:IclR family transcriptional regulator C-terminal domain-containing protein [Casimicrobiaceae bacterium]